MYARNKITNKQGVDNMQKLKEVFEAVTKKEALNELAKDMERLGALDKELDSIESQIDALLHTINNSCVTFV